MSPETTQPKPSTNQPINWEAFSLPLPSPRSLLVLLWSGLATAAIGLPLAIFAGGYSPYFVSAGAFLLIVGIGMAAIGFVMVVMRDTTARQQRYAKFLADNQFTPVPGALEDDIATSLVNIGRDEYTREGFEGLFLGKPFRLVLYQYTTGSGKSEQTHYFANMHIQLSQLFPLILLDDKDNHFLFFSDLPQRIEGGKALHLEGDFQNRYDVTVMPGTEQTVLELLTPDFMAELMDCSRHADIELEADNLYIIKHLRTETLQSDASILQDLFGVAAVVAKNIDEAAFSWQAASSKEAVLQIAETALAPRLNVLRRRKQVSIFSVVLIVVYVIYYLAQIKFSTSR